jgi:tetratricopeptide (TPR) repeat protein
MAIDKSRTPTWMRVVLILLAIAFVFGVASSSMLALVGGGSGSGTSGSQAASGTLDAAARNWAGGVPANEDALSKDPNNYDLLVAQANLYHDWAGEVLQASQNDQTLIASAIPIWMAAIRYYERALEVKPGDPSVTTDMSVSRFYSGDASGAVKTALAVTKTNPKFAPAYFNLGVFYENTGRKSESIGAFKAYLKIEPKGQYAQPAQEAIARQEAAVGQPGGTQGGAQPGGTQPGGTKP